MVWIVRKEEDRRLLGGGARGGLIILLLYAEVLVWFKVIYWVTVNNVRKLLVLIDFSILWY